MNTREKSPEAASTRQGFLDATWVAPIAAPLATPLSVVDQEASHSDSVTHTDSGQHVDAHGDHGDR
jgi:hypothetical protein